MTALSASAPHDTSETPFGQSVLSENKIDSVSQPGSTIPTIMAVDFNARHFAWNCKQFNPIGRSLADFSIQKCLSIEALNGVTCFPGNRSHSSDILDIFLNRDLLHPTSIFSFVFVLFLDNDPVLMMVTFVIDTFTRGRVTNDFLCLRFILIKSKVQRPKLQTPEHVDAVMSHLAEEINCAF